MKRCPKCGTVLDDDKRKCYMCGADLLKSAITHFGETFDAQIGATISNSQDNVFNSVGNIQADPNEAVGNTGVDNSTFTSSGADFYNNSNDNNNNAFSGLDGLNSMQYDNRTALEKIFSGNQRFKSKDEINAELAMKKNDKEQQTPFAQNNNFNNNQDVNIQGNNMVPFPQNNVSNPVGNMVNNTMNDSVNLSGQPNLFKSPQQNNVPQNKKAKKPFSSFFKNNFKKPGEEQEKKKINWGDNLDKKDNVLNKKFSREFLKNVHLDIGLIVNTACFIVFIIAMLIIYNKVIKPRKAENLQFGDLVYKINDDFLLKNEYSNSRTYTYGEECNLRITYGTAAPDDTISKYFDETKEKFSSNSDFITQESKLDINGNTWSSLEILQIEKNDSAISGTQTKVKYRYVTMIYDGNYYRIEYTNTQSDNKCSAMYDEMQASMSFKK